jgi:predicted ATPase
MITKLVCRNFKSFGTTGGEIPLGPLTLIVGTNASGKSNIRDALRFIHGISRGYSLPEIIGGKYGEGGERIWDGIRGGILELDNHSGGTGQFTLGVESNIGYSAKIQQHGREPQTASAHYHFSYEITIAIDPKKSLAHIVEESLKCNGKLPFSTAQAVLKSPQSRDPNEIMARVLNPRAKKFLGPTITLRREIPLVSQLSRKDGLTGYVANACSWFLTSIGSCRFLDLDPQALRMPTLPGQVVFGNKGENLPSILKAICEDPSQKEVLIDWIRELTPMDVTDLEFFESPMDGKTQTYIIEGNGGRISAHSASDGTLRFLAYLAALLGTQKASLYFFEEIENGIHPNRIHLLLELLHQSTKRGSPHVVATTHSPALLNFLRDRPLQDALVVARSERGSIVRRFADMPIIERDKTRAGELLQTGWFETTSTFMAADEQEKEQQPQ